MRRCGRSAPTPWSIRLIGASSETYPRAGSSFYWAFTSAPVLSLLAFKLGSACSSAARLRVHSALLRGAGWSAIWPASWSVYLAGYKGPGT